jgi:hypothetical protein
MKKTPDKVGGLLNQPRLSRRKPRKGFSPSRTSRRNKFHLLQYPPRLPSPHLLTRNQFSPSPPPRNSISVVSTTSTSRLVQTSSVQAPSATPLRTRPYQRPMKVFSTTSDFAYSWAEVTTANWHKYSPWNPKTPHVVAVDTLSRSVDPATGIVSPPPCGFPSSSPVLQCVIHLTQSSSVPSAS